MSNVIEVTGEIVRMIRKDSGWTRMTVRDKRKDYVLIGDMPAFTEGMRVKARGTQSVHPKWGEQINVEEIYEDGFTSADSLVKYLSGKAFKKVGVTTARSIVNHFGMDTISILDSDPNKILEVPGILPAKANDLINQWKESRDIHLIVTQLMSMGMPPNIANKIQKYFGELSISLIEKNPYCITEIPGIGFHTADEIAIKTGVPRNSPDRADAAVQYCMEQSKMSGHCYVIKDTLATETVKLLKSDINVESALKAIQRLVDTSILVKEYNKIYLSGMWHTEQNVSNILTQMINYPSKQYYKTLNDVIVELKYRGIYDPDKPLAHEQELALFNTMNNRVSVITGGPGVGKSFVTKTLCNLLEFNDISYVLCAPTGRAAKRLSEATGNSASTIHRLLQFQNGSFYYNAENPLRTQCVIVDEASMLDISLLQSLLFAMEKHMRLIFIGDVDQLPSVGPGNVLRDIIKSNACAVTRLTQIFRQQAGSTIVTVAHDILHGNIPELPTPRESKGRNCMRVSSEDQEDLIQKIITLVSKSLPDAGYKSQEIQVLTPMRSRGLGVEDLNPRLQSVLNPESPSKPEIQLGNRIFRVGDRVMQIRNNYGKAEEAGGVFNGDMGIIENIIKDGDDTMVYVKYPDIAESVSYEPSEWDELQHCFCVTVHKCIKKGELVLTEQGYKNIQDIVIGDSVAVGGNLFMKVVDNIESGVQEIYRLTTKNGYKIDATDKHPILVYDTIVNEELFKKIKDIKESDYIIIDRTIIDNTDILSSDMAWLLGYTVGDGNYNTFDNDYRIEWTGHVNAIECFEKNTGHY